MDNKYCNLIGTNKISDEYTKINDGFAGVEADVNAADVGIDAISERVNNHVVGTAERHTSDDINYNGAVGGATNIKDALDYLDERVDDIITTPAEGVTAQEIIDARRGETVLGARLDKIETHLTDITINVTTFEGVDKTGSTDSAAGIQNAINTIESMGGGVLFFPAGVYVIGTALDLCSNLTICGDKHNSKLYMRDNTSINMLRATLKNRITIKEMTIDGNRANNPYGAWPDTASQGVYFSKCADIFIVDNIFRDNCRTICVAGDNTNKVIINRNHFLNSEFSAIDNYGARMGISNNIFDSNVGAVIQIEPSVEAPYINYDSGNEEDFYGSGTENTYAVGTNIANNFINGGTHGIIIHSGSYDTVISGNNIQNVTTVGIYVKLNTTRTLVLNNVIRNITLNPSSSPELPWMLTGAGICFENCNISVNDNMIEFCHTGIYALNPKHAMISGNSVNRCRTTPICIYRDSKGGVIVENNYCFGSPTYEGIGTTQYMNGGIYLSYCANTIVKNNIVVADRIGRAWAAVSARLCGAIIEQDNKGVGVRYRVETGSRSNFDSALAFSGGAPFSVIVGAMHPKYGIYLAGSVAFCVYTIGYPSMLICTSAGGGYSTVWAPSTGYTAHQWVKTASGKIIMSDENEGTSGETDPDNLTLLDGTCIWKMSTGADANAYWQPSTNYAAGNKIKFSDQLSYECIQAGTSGTVEPEGIFVDKDISWRYMAEQAAAFINSVNGQNGYRTHAGAPNETPYFVGEELLDTTNRRWYKAAGITSGDWVAIN